MKKAIALFALVALMGSCEKIEVLTPDNSVQEQKLPYIKCRWYYVENGIEWEYWSGYNNLPFATWYNWQFGGCEWVGHATYGAAVTGVSDIIDTGYICGVNIDVMNENSAVIYSAISDSVGSFSVPDTIRGNTYNVRLRASNLDTTLQFTFDTASTLHPIILY